MNVQVLFFGATADEVGARSLDLQVESGVRAADAFEQILSAYPALRRHSLLFAVNQEYAKGDEIISTGDELAVFTAVSGG